MRISRIISALIILLTFAPVSQVEGQAASSVLASGTWRKVSVETTGFYCLTKSQLSSMGFTDPSAVRVYGAGGKQNSIYTSASDSRDDLYLLPAVHTDAGVVFFAQGPDAWSISTSGNYSLSLNAYSHKAYYYVTTGGDSDAPPAAEAVESTDEVETVTTYDFRFFYATQQVNAGSMGRYWFSSTMTTAKPSVTFPIDVACVEGSDVQLSYLIGAASRAAGSFTITIDDNKIESAELSTSNSNDYNYISKSATKTFKAPAEKLSSCTVTVDFTSSAAGAYLGTVTLQGTAPLTMSGSELQFRTKQQRNSEADALTFNIEGAPADTRVWDVTIPWTPTQCDVKASAGLAQFTANVGRIRDYVAFSPSGSFPSPTDEGSVANQNLHAHESVNYLVVTTPTFQPYAERLCQLHSRMQGLSSRVVMVDDIYNEFSAGRPEAHAIRNYERMLYYRGQGTSDQLTYVLLLGAGVYDNFDRSLEQNIIPTYQSSSSNSILTSYCTDDFYGWLNYTSSTTDNSARMLVGVGRIPCQTTAQAEAYVAKAEAYMENPTQGDWRAKAVFLGQAGDSNEHVTYSNRQADALESEQPDLDVVRIFSEAYTRITSSTGASYPMAVSTAMSYLDNGCTLYHYTGHAGAANTGDGFFSRSIASSLTNGGKNFILVGATCILAPFDQTTGNCSEDAIFNADGGAIAVFAATRETYGSPNYSVTRAFVKAVYALNDSKQRNAFGDAAKYAKLNATRGINTLKYVLLGDPALVVTTPNELYASLDSINGVAREECVTPVKALESSTVSCSVRDQDGNVVEDFTGKAIVSLYDKRVKRQTTGVASGTPYTFEEWGSKIFSGEVEVVNGRFSASFILSKEFDLSVGYGRLTAYAVGDDGRDAMGASDEIQVGGVGDSDLDNAEGPEIKAWVEYDNGTPYLHAAISDEQGVNTSGQGVGHDISLIVDGDRTNAISLNDNFTYDVGSYTSGSLTYPLTSYAGQRISLTLKAWDNLNNSSAVSLDVDLTGSVRSSVSAVRSGSSINVVVSTDAPAGQADVDVALYSIEGRLVAKLSSVEELRNGQFGLSLSAGGARAGIYILNCEMRLGEKKVTLSKKIFIKAQ